MIVVYQLEEVDREILQPLGWTDGVRWLKRRIAAGQIPGKRLSRNVFVMTDKHLEQWLEGDTAPVAKPASAPDPVAAPAVEEPVTFLRNLSTRSARRVKPQATA